MPTVQVEGMGWVDIVRDWYPTKIVGYSAGTPCTTRQWLSAVDRAVQGQFLEGARGQHVSLRSDYGGQPTSQAFRDACRIVQSPQAFPRDHHPQGKADTERVRRPVQEEGLWRQEWTCPVAWGSALDHWLPYDTAHEIHSTRGDKPPRQFDRASYRSHTTPCGAA
jgi:transposase InsO family protein